MIHLQFALACVFLSTFGPSGFQAEQGIGDFAAMERAIDAVEDEARILGIDRRSEPKQPDSPEVDVVDGLREQLACKLWCFTGSPEPLKEVPMFKVDDWEGLVKAYREVVRRGKKQKFDVFVRSNLEQSVEMLESRRCSQALVVLNWWIAFPHAGHEGRKGGAVSFATFEPHKRISEQSRQELRRKADKWWAANGPQLIWDPQQREFTGRGGMPLDPFWNDWHPKWIEDQKQD